MASTPAQDSAARLASDSLRNMSATPTQWSPPRASFSQRPRAAQIQVSVTRGCAVRRRRAASPASSTALQPYQRRWALADARRELSSAASAAAARATIGQDFLDAWASVADDDARSRAPAAASRRSRRERPPLARASPSPPRRRRTTSCRRLGCSGWRRARENERLRHRGAAERGGARRRDATRTRGGARRPSLVGRSARARAALADDCATRARSGGGDGAQARSAAAAREGAVELARLNDELHAERARAEPREGALADAAASASGRDAENACGADGRARGG